MSISISRKLSSLDISYPIWLFDLDQKPWPRKISNILPGSRPAKITGWMPWPWEYGTSLYRIDDPVPHGVIDTRVRDVNRLGDVVHVMNVLRYDDSFSEGTFEVLFESGKGIDTKLFDDWVFEKGQKDYIDSRRIVRLKRKWDDVPFWDREDCWNLFDDGENRRYTNFGVASQVHNEDELVAAAGIKERESGMKIRKAEFECVDGDKEAVKGIVFPNRHHSDRGLYMKQGLELLQNKEILLDTALEGLPWSNVEDYFNGRMEGPLWS